MGTQLLHFVLGNSLAMPCRRPVGLIGAQQGAGWPGCVLSPLLPVVL